MSHDIRDNNDVPVEALGMHERKFLGYNTHALRVHGGWIYTIVKGLANEQSMTSTFVPETKD